MEKSLSKACNHFGIEINNNQLLLFKKYYEILLEWNEKINLISRKGYDSILEKHFLDSIIFLPEINDLMRRRGPGTSPAVLDIGSGGGFPGIPLAIMKPEWDFTLCESTKKKANFLIHLIKELDLKNVKVINARVETLCTMSLRYDFITARAVAKLDILIKYALPILKPGGYLLAYKAKDIDEEIKCAEKIMEKKCNGKVTLPLLKVFTKEINGVERKLVALKVD